MQLDFNKVISCYNTNMAKLGREYYFFNNIDSKIIHCNFAEARKGKLDSIARDNGYNPFGINTRYFSFIYPVSFDNKRYMTYEEIYNLWQKDKLALYKVTIDSLGRYIKGFISAFEYNSNNEAIGFYIGDYLVSLGEDDEYAIHLSDVVDNNGYPLMITEGDDNEEK